MNIPPYSAEGLSIFFIIKIDKRNIRKRTIRLEITIPTITLLPITFKTITIHSQNRFLVVTPITDIIRTWHIIILKAIIINIHLISNKTLNIKITCTKNRNHQFTCIHNHQKKEEYTVPYAVPIQTHRLFNKVEILLG